MMRSSTRKNLEFAVVELFDFAKVEQLERHANFLFEVLRDLVLAVLAEHTSGDGAHVPRPLSYV